MVKDYILLGCVVFGIFYFPIRYYNDVDAKPISNIENDNNNKYKINNSYIKEDLTNNDIIDDIENIEFAKFPYKMSNNGKEFIKEHESLSLTKYHIKGESKYTIGWGHTIDKNEKIPNKISKSYAQKLFNNDISETNESINRLLKPFQKKNFKFTQEFVDGLGSLIFNCGETGVKNSEFYQTLLKCRKDKNEPSNINKRDIEYALSKVKKTHIYFEGHKKRRHNEYKLMSKL